MHDEVNILVVEDDQIDIESLKRLFAKGNIKNPVFYVGNGVEALELMRGENTKYRISKPYIILLDINMPLMNGLELLGELRSDEKLKSSLVFVLTTSPREEDKRRAYSLNVAGYFLKKDTKELITLLNNYWKINAFSIN